MKAKTCLCAAALLVASTVFGQPSREDSTFYQCFVGTSAFMLGNLFPNPPSFYQLNFGYWLSKKDVVSLEAITWTYDAPLGIPYGPSHGDKAERYPGDVRSFGVGAAYQRYIWKGWYGSGHVIPFWQQYRNTDRNKTGNGFQLYLILRTGYHLSFFGNRFFIEPSVAINYWPVNTGLPESFQRMERKWNNFFLPEPGLHLGFKF